MELGTKRGHHPPRSVWHILGIVLAVGLSIGGLVIVGLIVIVFVFLSSWGSNK
jgi:hypothetical protein